MRIQCVILFCAGALLLSSGGAKAQNPILVKDINPGAAGSGDYWTAVMNDLLYFSADDGTNGKELWRSDGSLAGTYMVKNIDGRGLDPRYPANCNGTLYFAGNDGVTGVEPWKSDGTANGTLLLKDMVPAGTAGGSSSPTSFMHVNGITYFSAGTALKRTNTGTGGPGYFPAAALCVTDGTTSGTRMISSTSALVPACMTAYNNQLYFYGTTWPNSSFWVRKGCQTELFRSNGTAKGTSIVKDINPGNEASSYSSIYTNYPVDRMVTTNGYLYFRADDGSHGSELWRSDGSSGGTVAEADIFTGSGAATPTWMTVMGNAIYFVAVEGADGDKLWKYDVGSRQVSLVKDINTGADSSFIFWLTAAGEKLFFSAKDPEYGQELWVSDGTPAGTTIIDINVGAGSSYPNYVYGMPLKPYEALMLHHGVSNFAVIGSFIYFAADDGVSGVELWRSDGATTEKLGDLNPGAAGSYPRYLTVVNGKLFFCATTPDAGEELWLYTPPIPKRAGEQAGLPSALLLEQNYPNPFNPSTAISYTLPAAGRVTLRIYDFLGREIRTLADADKDAGSYETVWDASGCSSGAYLCRLEFQGVTLSRVMHLLK